MTAQVRASEHSLAYTCAALGSLQPKPTPSNPGTVHDVEAGARLLVRDDRGRKAGGGQAVADLGVHQRRVGDRIVRARGTGRRLCKGYQGLEHMHVHMGPAVATTRASAAQW